MEKSDLTMFYLSIPGFKEVLISHLEADFMSQLMEWAKGNRKFPSKVEKFRIYSSVSLKKGLESGNRVEEVKTKIRGAITSQIESGNYSCIPFYSGNI